MSHYQKLALVFFRVIGLAIAVGMSIVLVLHIILYSRNGGSNSVELVSALLYTVLGILLTVLSKPLSRLAVKGIKE